MGGTVVVLDVLGAAAAAIISALMVDLLNDYKDEVEAEQRVLRDYLQMESAALDYYLNYDQQIMHPRKIAAINWVLDLEVPFPDPAAVYNTLYFETKEVYDAAKRGYEKLLGGYCGDCLPDCDNEFLLETTRVAGNYAYAHYQFDRRRYQERLAFKSKAHLAGLNIINKNPAHIFNYLRTAIAIQETVIAQASGGVNGIMGTLGYTLGSTINQVGDAYHSVTASQQQARVDRATVATANQNQTRFDTTGSATGPR